MSDRWLNSRDHVLFRLGEPYDAMADAIYATAIVCVRRNTTCGLPVRTGHPAQKTYRLRSTARGHMALASTTIRAVRLDSR